MIVFWTPERVVISRVLVGDELEHVEVAGHDRRVEAVPLGLDA